MPKIRLPDGAVKEYDAPVTVAEVAASIGPGLAKAALAGRVDGKLVDISHTIDKRCRSRDRHRQGSRRARGPAPFDRAPARVRGEGALSGCAGHDRPGDRGRLLLRLLVQAPVHARGSRGDRGEDGASSRGRTSPSPASSCRATRRSRTSSRSASTTRPRSSRRSLPTSRSRSTPKASSPTSAAARTCRRRASSRCSSSSSSPAHTGAAIRATRCCSGSTAPHGRRRKSSTHTCTGSRKPRSATTAVSAASSTSSTCRTRRRAWCSGIRRAGRSGSRSSSTCAASTSDNGYQEVKCPQILDRSLWENSGHWENFKENMFTTESEKRDYAIKPMNCPGHVQIFNSDLRSYRDLPLRYGEFGVVPPQRALRRVARHHARARLHAGRRPHLLHAGTDPAGGRRVQSARAEGLSGLRLRGRRDQDRAAARASASAATRTGTAPRARCATALAACGMRVDRAARRRRVLRPEDRIPPQGLDRPLVAMRDDAGRLLDAGPPRRRVRRPRTTRARCR